jgi:sec-independent protein translocase protein TatA
MYPLATFGNLAGFDGIFIFMVLLLLFGAKKLPELAKGLGSAVREFSKAKDEIHHEMTRPADVTPRIEPPRYTEPHLTAAADPAHAVPTHSAQDSVQAATAATSAGGSLQSQPLGANEPVIVTEESQHSAPTHQA